jgi:Raf kinase inhibitor-like YbhB/YbcL family protein
MKRIFFIIGVFFCTALAVFFVKRSQSSVLPTPVREPLASEFSLVSSGFLPASKIPSRFTCDGANVSPPLEITDVPKNTKSLVIIVDDIDTPQQTWVHWLVWNIQPDTKTIAMGNIPKGAAVGTNSFGNTTYGGPCPPSGRHRYVFRLYAIDTYLVLTGSAIKKNVIDAMNTHVIGQTELMGYYER